MEKKYHRRRVPDLGFLSQIADNAAKETFFLHDCKIPQDPIQKKYTSHWFPDEFYQAPTMPKLNQLRETRTQILSNHPIYQTQDLFEYVAQYLTQHEWIQCARVNKQPFRNILFSPCTFPFMNIVIRQVHFKYLGSCSQQLMLKKSCNITLRIHDFLTCPQSTLINFLESHQNQISTITLLLDFDREPNPGAIDFEEDVVTEMWEEKVEHERKCFQFFACRFPHIPNLQIYFRRWIASAFPMLECPYQLAMRPLLLFHANEIVKSRIRFGNCLVFDRDANDPRQIMIQRSLPSDAAMTCTR